MDWTTEIHDAEIFLLYKGAQAGMLWPSPEFPVAKTREVVATLNAAVAIRAEHAAVAAHNAGQSGMPQGPCQCLICKS